MKTKLLLMLLFVSSYTFAQTWSQVGATQFTNEASSAAMTFDNTGIPYVVYTNSLASNKAYVKKFDGTNWVDIAVPEVATVSGDNVAIKFDPTTNDLFVAFRNSTNNMNCYKFNGTSWIAVFTNMGSSSALADHRLQIQFNGSSTVRVSGKGVDESLTIIERDLSGAGPNLTELIDSNPNSNPQFYSYDFTSYSKYYISFDTSLNSTRFSRKAVGTTSFTTSQYSVLGLATTGKNISGIDNENYLAFLDFPHPNVGGAKEVRVFNGSTNILTTAFSDNFLKFRKNTLDNKLYLMYSDAGGLAFKKYNKTTSTWSNIPQIGIATNTANFIADMEINQIDGDIYTYYLDGSKISVKKHTPSLCDPENVQVSNISITTADVTWNAPTTSVTNWEIALVLQGQSLGSGTFYTSTTNAYSFTNLSPSTPYDVYVRALCNGSFSAWTAPTAFLTPNPPTFVDLNATAGNLDGTSWADAYTNIQEAIDNTNPGSEIWVAQGTYKPTTTSANPRKSTYKIDKILQIYGGFIGNENLRSQRNAVANVTILNGDLNGDDNANIVHNESTRSDNAYHVISLKGNFNAGTIIDGFTITSGNANGNINHVSGAAGYNDETGAAIYPNPNGANNKVSIEIKNCIIEKNTAQRNGVMGTYSPSGATGTYSKIDFISTIIRDNNSNRSILDYGASGTYANRRFGDIINCLITDNENSDLNYGVVLYANVAGTASTPTCGVNIINSTIANNTSNSTWVMTFGSINGTSTIDNSIIYDNSTSTPIALFGTNTLTASNSIIEGGLLSALNIDPKFNNIASQDYSLDATSPAIDTGDNSLIPTGIVADLLGNQRIFNTTVDMGPYEFGSSPLLAVEDFENELSFIVYPNPVTDILNIKMDTTFEKAEIYNILGEKILMSDKKTIDVSRFQNGVYFVKIANEKGLSVVKRFIKH